MKRCIFLLTLWLTMLSTGNVLFAQHKFWEQTTGPSSVRINALAVNQVGNIYAGTTNGVFVTTNGGTVWNVLGLVSNNVIGLAINPSRHIFAAQEGKGIQRSTNLGVNWTSVYNRSVNSIGINKRGDILAAADSGVLRSYDNGVTWSYVSLPLTKKALTIHISDRDVIYLGTQSGGVLKSTDGGDTWVNIGLMGVDVNVILATTDYLYAGSRFSGLHRLPLNGTTWTEANTGLGSREVLALTYNKLGHILLGTGQAGIYRSKNSGAAWESFNTGMTSVTAVPALVRTSDDFVFAGTDKQKVFKSENTTLAIRPAPQSASLAIGENYPNPFTDGTIIPVSSRSGNATLRIYDLLGTLQYEQRLEASEEPVRVLWRGETAQGRTAQPGVYIVRVTDSKGNAATRSIHRVK